MSEQIAPPIEPTIDPTIPTPAPESSYKKYLTAGKEVARLVILAAVSTGVTVGINYLSNAISHSHLSVAESAILISALTSAGKAWDKAIHDDPTTSTIGLVGF